MTLTMRASIRQVLEVDRIMAPDSRCHRNLDTCGMSAVPMLSPAFLTSVLVVSVCSLRVRLAWADGVNIGCTTAHPSKNTIDSAMAQGGCTEGAWAAPGETGRNAFPVP